MDENFNLKASLCGYPYIEIASAFSFDCKIQELRDISTTHQR